MNKLINVPLMINKEYAQNMDMQSGKYQERELSSYVTMKTENTALLKVYGPLMRHGSFWSEFFGISAYSAITKEFKRLVEDENVENIIIDFDSPGGSVNGVAELAELIYRARNQKNIISYISGMGCSAAYYLASATSKVYANKIASVGSIGVICCIRKEKEENVKVIEIVSSKSEDKRLDPETAKGQAKLQKQVDTLADEFMADVARYRNIDIETVEATNGGTFIGEEGLKASLVDEISDLETILEELDMTNQDKATVQTEAKEQEVKAVEPTVDAAAIKAEERQRVAKIMNKASELGSSNALASKLVESEISAEEAISMLEAAETDKEKEKEKEPEKQASTGFEEAMAKTSNPTIEARDDDVDSEESIVNTLVRHANEG